jgi:hypothetical protein
MDTTRAPWPGRALWVGVLALLLQACAVASGAERVTRAGSLGLSVDGREPGPDFPLSLGPPPSAVAESTEPAARGAEAEQALAQVEAVLGATSALGDRWRFRYWTQNGALTLLSFRREEEGRGARLPVNRGTLTRDFAHNLPTLLGTQAREVTLTLERRKEGWAAALDLESREASPAEARTLPAPRPGTPRDTYQQLVTLARAMARALEVPERGHAKLQAEVNLEDARVTGWEPGDLALTGDGPRRPATQQAVSTVINALLPFTNGLGARTVRLKLEGTHPPGAHAPRWEVVDAETLRPPPPPEELEDFASEYRAMHERILWEWREETRDSAVLLAGFTAEQLAWWLVGGFVTQRAVVLFKAAAPTVASVLSKGGTHAVRWFRALLIRMSPAERATLQRLWLKAEAQGIEALTAAEKAEFRALMGRLEKLIHTPVEGGYTKDSLRGWARKEYFEVHNPKLAKALGEELIERYDVHHILPLEYAHLFPKMDINAKANLVGLAKPVHESIGAVWTQARRASQRITPREVEKVARIIDKHYSRWFDKVYDSSKSASALARAEQTALAEVQHLLGL